MSAPIGPGDWVECTTDNDPERPRGSIWQVLRLGAFDLCTGHGGMAAAVYLTGVDPLDEFCAGCEIRPIYRPKADAFDHLLEVTDDCDGAARVREGKLWAEPSNLPQAIVDDQMERAA